MPLVEHGEWLVGERIRTAKSPLSLYYLQDWSNCILVGHSALLSRVFMAKPAHSPTTRGHSGDLT